MHRLPRTPPSLRPCDTDPLALLLLRPCDIVLRATIPPVDFGPALTAPSPLAVLFLCPLATIMPASSCFVLNTCWHVF
ncbi:hypothetical protein GUJ93_ZPchr0011g27356 [Zizania palustris]|uniref:Uncharacterized protein n=1 Tax=Zizania palustris TaxID=103762 RepID=A0A8J5WHZ7_ZIZPA|nr:hypothetical protein GUJ93_ZPchr0011g27356 [Zizania palustris]